MNTLKVALLSCLLIPLSACKFFSAADESSQVSSSADSWEPLVESFDYNYNYRILTTSVDEKERFTEGSRKGGLDSYEDEGFEMSEGSGKWGQDCINDGKQAPCGSPSDHLSHAIFSRMADIGGGLGYKLAAEFFHHYLKNSGTNKQISNGKMLQLAIENMSLKGSLENSGYSLIQPKIGLLLIGMKNDGVLRKGGNVPVVRWRTGTYFDDRPMYFAVGGAQLHFEAGATITSINNGSISVQIVLKHHMTDRYNWDKGKSITLFDAWCHSGKCQKIQDWTKLEVRDADIGKLHSLGMAQEFDVRGDFQDKKFIWQVPISDLDRKAEEWRGMIACSRDPMACADAASGMVSIDSGESY